MMRIIKETNINFVGRRKYAFFLSGLLVILGIVSFVSILVGKANLGLDFTGGAQIIGSFEQPVTAQDIRSALDRVGLGKASIQALTGTGFNNSFIIRIQGHVENAVAETTFTEDGKPTVNMVAAEGDKLATLITDAILKHFPNNRFKIDSTNNISGKVGKQLAKDATWAVVFAFLGIMAYIWIRFDFRFGVAATVATFHDVLAMLGIYFIMQREITLLLITALLTVAGYSLTDTVVVFDRIRENLKQFRKRSDFLTTVNTSINEVLQRTIITSLTTQLAVLAILIFGGEVLFDFALALVIGICIGTYSSIFVASPIIVEWEKRSPRRLK
jgi:preprotein translocase subunit SecF